MLVKHHTDLARWRNKLCCRLHALVAELTGGISKEVVVTQARRLLEKTTPVGVAAVERHRLAVELVAEIEHLNTSYGPPERGSPPPWRRRGRRCEVELHFLVEDVDVVWERIERRQMEQRWGARPIRRDELERWVCIIEHPDVDELKLFDSPTQ